MKKKASKKATTKTKDCGCFDKVNTQLSDKGLQLDHRIQFNFEGGNHVSTIAPLIALQWNDPKRKKKTPVMFCSYCPFCGKKKPT